MTNARLPEGVSLPGLFWNGVDLSAAPTDVIVALNDARRALLNNATEKDRARAIQLIDAALPVAMLHALAVVELKRHETDQARRVLAALEVAKATFDKVAALVEVKP